MNVCVSRRFYLFTLGLLAACGQQPQTGSLREAPDSRNKASLLGVALKRFDTLQIEANLGKDRAPWSDDYWPTYRGGTAFRWQTMGGGTRSRDFVYELHSKEQVQSLSQDQLDSLSPAEKYDLLLGDFNFTLTKQEKHNAFRAPRDETGDIPRWFGLCHGWAAASYMTKQPGARASLQSPDGIQLNFFSSDIKALLSKHFADAKVVTNFVGGRCNARTVMRDARGRALQSECRDVNPATFHLAIEDYVARRGTSLVMDVEAGLQVWNQPVVGYRFQYSNLRPLRRSPYYLHPAPGTVDLIDVDMTLRYVHETAPSRVPVEPYVVQRAVRYTLELDRDGVIIGGEWQSAFRPDFLWQLTRVPDRVGDGGLNYQILSNLVNLSRGERLVVLPKSSPAARSPSSSQPATSGTPR